jgi:hypothetical protein
VKRDADRYRNEWSALARNRGFILVVPEFDERNFPGARSYNLGNVFDEAGQPVPNERWSFSAIEPLFDAVREMTGTRVTGYGLYGHSAGAQFVHRYVLFMPAAHFDKAVAANAGWYTMPQQEVGYPYGLGGSGLSDEGLRAALQRPLTILLGTADVDERDPNLRRAPEALAQGVNRVQRGERFFGAATATARELKAPLAWRLGRVEGGDHSNSDMAGAAPADLLGLGTGEAATD